MITKICLFLAIVASAGTVFLVHTKVDQRIKDTEAKVQEAETKASGLQNEKTALNGQLSKAKAAADELSNKLAAATKDAEAANDRAGKAEQAVTVAKKETDTARAETEKVKDQNKEYFDLKKTPAEIKKAFAELPKVTAQLDTVTKENKVIATKLKKTEADLDAFLALSKPGPPMPGLKGSVMSVDPKWGFVIIDTGVDRGALTNGELKVNRGGQLIARLRITKVEKNHSVANIIQGSAKSEILEGDQVLY